ncbi:cysteine desulfurase family protein [Virgibacillus pantothenticus]|uniref:cysteine desulfurase family protein n=1 Tax=Virgibacillus pantothenticus TaxID=1473 RepID=UPI0009863650|nr:cysteine desulfurase family protein [Virgibacillus pantothenticus]
MIYLDNSATTKPEASVLKSFEKVSTDFFANPSSIHPLGGESEKLLHQAKDQAATLLEVARSEIVFTSGGTEGNNLAIKGIALEHQHRGKHIITTAVEHASVYEACKSLEKLGFNITYLPVNQDGIINVNDLQAAIQDDTILISIMHVNSELGSIQPIKEVGAIAKKYPKLFFHVDHVQGLGKVPLSLKDSGIDLCTMSGHKIHGLKGTGLLYIRNRTTLFPLFHGGAQEQAKRSGTENLAGAVSFVRALRLILERERTHKHELLQMQQYIRKELEKLPDVFVNTPLHAAPHIINFSVPGVKPEVLIHLLAENDIYISTKSACSSKQTDESKILAACGLPKKRTTSALRVSLTYTNTMEELQQFMGILRRNIQQLKKVME